MSGGAGSAPRSHGFQSHYSELQATLPICCKCDEWMGLEEQGREEGMKSMEGKLKERKRSSRFPTQKGISVGNLVVGWETR